jgi:hypothetical protein
MTPPNKPNSSPELTEVERAREAYIAICELADGPPDFMASVRRGDRDNTLAIQVAIEALSSKNELPCPFTAADVTDEMLNAGQERLCEIRNTTHFDDEAQAEIFAAMLAALNPKDTGQTAPYSDDHLGIDGGFQ